MKKVILSLILCALAVFKVSADLPERVSDFNVETSVSADNKTLTVSVSDKGKDLNIADFFTQLGYSITENKYENIVIKGGIQSDVIGAINNANLTTVKHIDMGGVNQYNGSTKTFNSKYLKSLVLSDAVSQVSADNSSSDDFVLLKKVTTYVNSRPVQEWQATAKVSTAGSLAESMSYLDNYSIDKLTVTGSLASQDDANALNATKVDLSGVTSYTQPTSNSKTKYIIMPASETELSAADFTGMSAVLEAITVYTDDDNVKCLATYSKSSSTGLLENVLAMTTTWKDAKKITMVGTYKDILSYMYMNGGYTDFAPTSLDLTNAHFPCFTSTSDFKNSSNQNYTYVNNDEEGYCLYKTTTQYAIHNLEDDSKTTTYLWTGRINGLLGITLIGGSLTSISLPTGADTDVLPSYALYNVKNITELTIPANIKSIGTLAFNNMSALTSVKLLGAEEMGAGAFASCTSMSTIDIPSSLKVIPPYCFVVCASLKNVNLPEGVEDIEEAAFAGNSSTSIRIDAIRLPSTLKTIGYQAFKENHYLASITIPENVTYIAKEAFGNCNAIEDVYFMGTTTIPTVEPDAFDATTLYNDNGVNTKFTDGTYVAQEFYSKNGAYASNTRNITDQGAAILHYPIVTSVATYSSDPVTADDIANYKLAANTTIPTIYTDVDGVKTPYTGTLVAGSAYYIEGEPTTATTTTSTNTPVSGITKYYSDAEGTTEITPVLASGNYWYNCGTTNIYTTTTSPVAASNGIYYSKSGSEYSVVNVPTLRADYYYYTKSETKVPIYSQTYTYISGITTYYSDAEGTTVVQPTLNSQYGYYYYDSNSNAYMSATYYDSSVTYYTLQWVSGTQQYVQTEISQYGFSGGPYYYKSGEDYKFSLSTEYIPGKQYYQYSYNPAGYNEVEESNLQFSTSYYYITGTAPTYCNAAGAAYDPSVTYYTSSDATTQVSSISFADTYYYYGLATTYTAVSDDDLTTYIKVQSAPKVLYSKIDDEYTLVSASDATTDGTYYTQLTEASSDLYGQYYTDLARNAKYTLKLATYDEETGKFTEISSLSDYRWPDQNVFMAYNNYDYGDDPQAGIKRFELVMGYNPTPSEPTEDEEVPIIDVPNLKYDIWYTIYLPYNMTSAQVRETFGATTQVCNFLGIRTETVNDKTINTIDFSKNMITEQNADKTDLRYGTYDVVIEHNHPYMIRPSVVSQLDADGKKIAVQFRAMGVTYVAKKSKGEVGADMPYGEYDDKNGGTKVTADYLPGYQFVGTYGQDNDGVTPVVMNDPCYYFGTIWADAEKTTPKIQAYYNYRGYEAEGNRSLTWTPYTCVILPPAGQEGAKVSSVRYGIEYDEAYDGPTATQAVKDITVDTVSSSNNKFAGKVYNLNGQFVGTSLKGLESGLYIVNGKKVIVK